MKLNNNFASKSVKSCFIWVYKMERFMLTAPIFLILLPNKGVYAEVRNVR